MARLMYRVPTETCTWRSVHSEETEHADITLHVDRILTLRAGAEFVGRSNLCCHIP
jgi:hypothetical protein